MFDTYVRERDVHNHIKIEQRPHDTADAARLYGECVARAEKEVASAAVDRFGANNELVALTVDSMTSYESMEQTTRIIFKLNGHLHDIRVAGDTMKARDAFYREVGMMVLEEVGRTISGKGKLAHLAAESKP